MVARGADAYARTRAPSDVENAEKKDVDRMLGANLCVMFKVKLRQVGYGLEGTNRQFWDIPACEGRKAEVEVDQALDSNPRIE
jgi:hypothetical protein